MRTRAGRRVVRGLGLAVLLLLSLPAAALAASERARTAASADYLGIGRAYQPTMYVDREDRFWPASFLNVLGLTWDNRYTCLNRKDRPKVCGGPGRPLSVGLLPAGGGSKSDYLDYPAGRGDIDDQAKSFAQKVGSPANSRVYFFAGYGQRKTRTIASFQYWYFYNFNYVASSVAFRGYHEGDLEQVAILFRAGKLIRTPNGRVRRKVPKYVFLSQHTTRVSYSSGVAEACEGRACRRWCTPRGAPTPTTRTAASTAAGRCHVTSPTATAASCSTSWAPS